MVSICCSISGQTCGEKFYDGKHAPVYFKPRSGAAVKKFCKLQLSIFVRKRPWKSSNSIWYGGNMLAVMVGTKYLLLFIWIKLSIFLILHFKKYTMLAKIIKIESKFELIKLSSWFDKNWTLSTENMFIIGREGSAEGTAPIGTLNLKCLKIIPVSQN